MLQRETMLYSRYFVIIVKWKYHKIKVKQRFSYKENDFGRVLTLWKFEFFSVIFASFFVKLAQHYVKIIK